MGLGSIGKLLSDGGIGDLIEGGIEKAALALGIPPEQAEKLGDVAHLVYNIKTGNVIGGLAEIEDLTNADAADKAKAKEQGREGGATSQTYGGYVFKDGHWERTRGGADPGTVTVKVGGGAGRPGIEVPAWIADTFGIGQTNANTEVRDHRSPQPEPLASDFTDYLRGNGAANPGRNGSVDEWRKWLKTANGAQISEAIQNGEIPEDVLKDKGMELQIGEKIKAFDRLFTLLKSILDARHETSKAASSFRV
jgi:hypothetical protein